MAEPEPDAHASTDATRNSHLRLVLSAIAETGRGTTRPRIHSTPPQIVETPAAVRSARPKRRPRRPTETDVDPSPDLPQIPGYRILRAIGGGGMGTVFKAVHLELNKRRGAEAD